MVSHSFVASRFDECLYFLYPKRRSPLLRELPPPTHSRLLLKAATGRIPTPPRMTIMVQGPAATLVVNTHVDGLNAPGTDESLDKLDGDLVVSFGKRTRQDFEYDPIGTHYKQNRERTKIQCSQRGYAEKLEFYPVPKERRAQGTSTMLSAEQTGFRSVTGGVGWYLRTRAELVPYVRELQTEFQEGIVNDLISANSLVKHVHETLHLEIVYRSLPHGPCRLVLWPDCAKGDYNMGSQRPVIGYFLSMQPDTPETFDGPAHIYAFLGEQTTRVSKSSLHGEGIAAAVGTEQMERCAGMMREHYNPPLSLEELIPRQEAGAFDIPCDIVTGAKSLYDVPIASRAPSPTDDGSRLWLTWLKDRVDRGSIRGVGWCSTVDMVGDGLTKCGIDPTPIIRLTMEGRLEATYSMLRSGVLLDAHKGLPLPKRERDAASASFLELIAAVSGRR